MPDANEMDLVRDYARCHSEPAFAELVRRHINLIYSVALRCTSNVEDAQDVMQAVFIILAQKAAGLRERTVLTGWLAAIQLFQMGPEVRSAIPALKDALWCQDAFVRCWAGRILQKIAPEELPAIH